MPSYYKFTTTVVILSKQQSFGANFDCAPWLLKRLRTRRGTERRTGRLHLAHVYKILAKILRSDFSTAGCSKEARNAAWRSNSAEVSAVSDILRTEECQKHWHIIKSEARRNTRKQREAMTATGGGPPANPPLSQLDELIFEILDPKNVFIHGCTNKASIIECTFLNKGKATCRYSSIRP
ncbi:uncharacterized protein LOC123511115 [Portunus trituberculatus]|uniref:uncharacterized protein LOC123511115 n=1 Tax=Portunus trituberculatus TaxID=210409 RepID=UPI001E1CCF3D|nr:uncharacterized protein LOC123511115 [Portunus trituberculatus]